LTCFEILERGIPETGEGSDVRRFRVCVPPASPYFTGHFEGQPVLPAVAQLALIQELAEEQLAAPFSIVAVQKARFRTPVGPSDVLEVMLSMRKGSDRLHFGIKLGEQAVCEGLLTVRLKGLDDVP
jgi:3-hydroxymyristoyl/3-hydroxydecanoyl-(acyl carrier protein) dehydratase